MSVVYTNFYQKGTNVRLRIMDKYGNRRMVDKKYEPELYALASDKRFSGEPSEFKGLHLEPLKKIKFKSFWEMRDFLETNKDVSDVKIYGQDDFCNQFIAKNFKGHLEFNWRHLKLANVDIEVVSGYRDENGEIHNGPFPQPIIYEDTFSVINTDDNDDEDEEDQVDSNLAKLKYIQAVEKSHEWLKRDFPGTVIPSIWDLNAAFPITLIQISTYDNITGEKFMFVWGLPEPNARGIYKEAGTYEGGYKSFYYEFNTEQELLTHFIQYWFKQSFDVWTGWNIETFDNPYLYERIRKILGEENAAYLSPWKDVKQIKYKNANGVKRIKYRFQGTDMIDYIDLYKKHCRTTRESYSLDHIGYVETGERKLDYAEARTLTMLYFTNWTKYVDYGKKDIRLVDRINDKLKYMQLTYAIAYKAKCNFEDALGTVQPWNALMGWFLLEKGIRPLIRRVSKERKEFDGGYVKAVIAGFYKWLISIDLNSLYPHIMQQYNLGIETKVSEQERFDILFDLEEEIRVLMLAEFDLKRKSALRKLMESVAARSTDIVDELINVGKIELQTLRDYNVAMTPNLHFFKRDTISAPSEVTRMIYGERKVFKKRMQHFEQRGVWVEEYINAPFVPTEQHTSHRAWDDEFYTQLKQLEKEALENLLHELADCESEQDSFQQGMKILMNAFYGAMTTIWFKDYFDVDIGEGICASGRLINKWNMHYLNQYLNSYLGTNGQDYIPAGDTDSNYVTLDAVVKKHNLDESDITGVVKFLDQFTKKEIEPRIAKFAEDLCVTVNGYEQRMFWEREVIAISAIWQAPKMYVMAVKDSEGTYFEEPYIKITGVAAKKSDYPEWSRNHMKKVYKICLLGSESEVKEYIKKVREEWKQLPIEVMAAAKGIKNMDKWYDASDPRGWSHPRTPAHVRAAYAHNKQLEAHPIPGVKPIASGDKILLVSLKDNNPFGVNSFAFSGELPPEWDVNKYVDKDAMLHKIFIKPLSLILEKIGWSHDTRHSFTKSGDVDPSAKRLSGRNSLDKAKRLKTPVKTTATKLW